MPDCGTYSRRARAGIAHRACCLFCLLAGGCGFARFPVARELPGLPAGVRVVSEETGDDIGDATLACSIAPFENWLQSLGPSTFDPATVRADAGGASRTQLRVERDADNVFRIAPVKRTAYVKPWGYAGPMGTTLYEDFTVSLVGCASGYQPVGLEYYAAAPPAPGRPMRDENGFVSFGPGGRLVLRLKRAARPPAEPPRAPAPPGSRGPPTSTGCPFVPITRE